MSPESGIFFFFLELGIDMRCLIFKIFISNPSIFNRHLKFLCLGSKRVKIFYFVLKLNWGCSKWVQIALFGSWNNFWLSVPFSDWLFDFLHFLWSLLYLLYIGFEHKLRIIVSSTSVQDINRAASATFRTQIEQIRTHFEQPQIRFRAEWKIWTLFEPQLKKLKCL